MSGSGVRGLDLDVLLLAKWQRAPYEVFRSLVADRLRASPTFVPTKEVLQCSHIRANYLDRLAKKDGD